MVLGDQQTSKGLKTTTKSSRNDRKSKNPRERSNHGECNMEENKPTEKRISTGASQRKSFLPPISSSPQSLKKSGVPSLNWSGIPVTQAFRNSWKNNSVQQSFRKVLPRRLNPLEQSPVGCILPAATSLRSPCLSGPTGLQSSPSSFQQSVSPLSKTVHQPKTKVLFGEFTHIPAASRIFAAKPRALQTSPTAFNAIKEQNKHQHQPCSCHFVPISTAAGNMETHESHCSPTILIDSVGATGESDLHDLSGNSSPECELPPQLAAMVVRSRPPLIHTVSIVIEPVVDSMGESESDDLEDDLTPAPSSPNRDLLDDDLEPKEDLVKHVMDVARLRKEEFARLLEEHAQIVNEINRAENSLIL